MIACRPEPQSRLTVSAGASFGMPDLRPMWRAKYTASPDVWRTLPKMTWSICFGSTLDFSSAPFAAMMPRSVAEVSRSAPPYVPKAVRAPSMMTMSFMGAPDTALAPLASIVPPDVPGGGLSTAARRHLLDRYVVVERVGGIGRVVVVVVDERERVRVRHSERRGLAAPGSVVGARPCQHRRRRARGVVAKGGCGPVVGH